MSPQLPTTAHGTQCLCASCTATPAETSTEAFKLECLARAYGHYSEDQKEKFLHTLKMQKGWEQRLASLESLLEKLRSEGRYETAYWSAKSRAGTS